MGFRLYASAYEVFGHTDGPVRVGQILIQRQSALALSNALSNSVRKDLDDAQDAICHGVVRSQGQCFERRPLSSS